MARQGLARPLAAAIRQAAVEQKQVDRHGIRVKTNGEFMYVDFSVSRIDEPEAIRGLLLVTIAPAQPVVPAREGKKTKIEASKVEEVERELQYLRESHQTTVEELETSNEELKSTNEELQSTNEELQSTNEELETSKEEMQSLNEELSTVNAELSAKVDELSRATDDMQNLLNSTQVAMIFLDNQLNVKRYTEQATDLFNLMPNDVGAPWPT
jgi:two-component system CheB/CheR fusion protein